MRGGVTRGTVAAALVVAVLAGACAAWLTRPAASARAVQSTDATTGRTATTPATPAPDDPTSFSGSSGAMPPAPSRAATGSGARTGRPPAPTNPPPSRLEIPRLGLHMDVTPVGVASDGQMALPPDPADLGWYRYGPRPGDARGAAVLAAHLDAPGYGTGPIAEVERLRTGDIVVVRSGSVTRSYAVTGVSHLKKTALDLDKLFSRAGPARLHLVTCGGDFDPELRRYDENIVVVAQPVR